MREGLLVWGIAVGRLVGSDDDKTANELGGLISKRELSVLRCAIGVLLLCADTLPPVSVPDARNPLPS